MPVFRVERTHDYTVMSNFHLKDKRLSLKAKGLLSQMLSLPDDLAFASSTEKAKMPFVLQSMNWNALGIFDADKLQMPPGSSGPTNTASMSAPLQIVRRWGVRHRKNRQRKSR